MRSALWLIWPSSASPAFFVLLQAEFLAVTQVLVYIGAISTLIIFAIMLSRGVMDPNAAALQRRSGAWWAALLRCCSWPWRPSSRGFAWPRLGGRRCDVPADAIQRLGMDFVGPYAVPFEVASVLLVVAMIGAIIIAANGSNRGCSTRRRPYS